MADQSTEHLVVVGASHCGVQSAFAARRAGFDGRITVFGDEPDAPYHRPPLSKDILTGTKTTEDTVLRPASAFARAEIDLRLGQRVTQIDRGRQCVLTDADSAQDYSHLLLATGARPRRLPVPGADLDTVHYLRSAADARALHAAASGARSAVVVGGGYIGLEAAASLRQCGLEVTVIEAMPRVLQRVASPSLSEYFSDVHRREGVQLLTRARVTGFEMTSGQTTVVLDSAQRLPADLVIVGIGVVPNAGLAEQAGLVVDNGIVVDALGQTSDPRIFAAGDCASGYHQLYERHVRLESVQNANDQGKTAIMAMLGQPQPYAALPWFWSDQYNLKLQIAGLIDGADRTVRRVVDDRTEAFSLCHLQGNRLVAVEAVNAPRDFLSAKAPIAAQSSVDYERLADPTIALAECILPS